MHIIRENKKSVKNGDDCISYKISAGYHNNNNIPFNNGASAMKHKNRKKDPPCKDAFLHTPVASVHDCTGFSPTKTYSEEEAISKSQLCDVPTSSADGSDAVPPAK